MQLSCTWNWHDPRLLSQEPRECDLGGGDIFLVGNPGQQIDQRAICLPRFRREARHIVTEVVAIECGVLVDRPREVATAKRTEWHKSDPKFLKRRHDFRFGFTPPD